MEPLMAQGGEQSTSVCGKPGWEIWGCLGPSAMELAPQDEHGLGCGCLDDLSREKGVNEPFSCFSLIKK